MPRQWHSFSLWESLKVSTSSTDSIQLNQPTWLLIDTTGQGCHIGLTHQGVYWTDSDMQPQSHTKRILPMIESLLTQAKLSMNDVQGIVYTKGPGSFTGVRVGCPWFRGWPLLHPFPPWGFDLNGISVARVLSNTAAECWCDH